MEGRCVYRVDDGKLVLHADLTRLAPHMANDMVVDAQGRAYVDNSGYNPFQGGAWTGQNFGSIILVEADGRAREVATGLAFPNGSLITPEGRLVVGESRAGRLTSFRIDDDGSLSDRRLEAEVAGDPDGSCLDLEGGVWTGLGKAEVFVRTKDGKVTASVPTPGRKAVACQLGGEDGRTLFCLTFVGEIPMIGSVFTSRLETVRVEAPGANSP